MEGGRPKYAGLINCFSVVLKEEGAAALYGGMVSHVLRTVPSAAITYGTYGFVSRFIERRSLAEEAEI